MTASGVRRGEWLELRVPDAFKEKPVDWLNGVTPLPGKLLQKLADQNGYLLKGDRLHLKLFPEEKNDYRPEWTDLGVLFEDDYCLVVHKPAGMAVHPAREGQTGTLANAVAAYYESTGQSCRIRHIHRLDADTTGPVLYAKNELAHLLLDEQLREKTVGRVYAAAVKGIPREPAGRIDAPIGKDRHNSKRRRVSPGGEPAATRYQTLSAAHGAALVRLRLETGRTHQIRVHMSHIGHPLIGDTLYGGPANRIGRQALHGESLGFRHPWTGEPVAVADPYPADFAALLRDLGLTEPKM